MNPYNAMDVDIDGVEVQELNCEGCEGDLYAVYKEEDVEVSLDAIASQFGLEMSRSSTDTKVIGTHEIPCPFCGRHLSFRAMFRMKLAGYLFDWDGS